MKRNALSGSSQATAIVALLQDDYPGSTWEDVRKGLDHVISHKSESGGTNLDRLLTVQRVADLLGLSTRTVYDMIRRGTLPAKRLGNRATRIPESAVKSLLEGEDIPGSLSGKSPSTEGRV